MKRLKYYFLFFFLLSLITAKSQDTLSKQGTLLLKLMGGFIKTGITETIKENGTSNGFKGIVGSGIKSILKTTITKSGSALSSDVINFGNNIPLPKDLIKNKDRLIQKGKGELLNNFHQALKNAAADALDQSIPIFVAQAIDFNVDDLVKFANSDSGTLTDIFKNANKNALTKIAMPIVKKSLKLAGVNKYSKKIIKSYQKIIGEKLLLNNSEFLSEEIINRFFTEMKLQEQQLKQNPSSLLDTFKKIINN